MWCSRGRCERRARPVPHQFRGAGGQRRADVVPPPQRRLQRAQDQRLGRVEARRHDPPESLTVLNDPVLRAGGTASSASTTSATLADGTITLHDNGFGGTAATRQPRAVRYVLDLTPVRPRSWSRRTIPPRSRSRVCCGSARKLPGRQLADGMGQRRHHHRAESRPAAGSSTSPGTTAFLLPVPPRALRSGQPHSPAGRHGRAVPAWPCPPPVGDPGTVLPRARLQAVRVAGPHSWCAPRTLPSCSSPAGASDFLTVGTDSTGSVIYKAFAGNPSTPANEADVSLTRVAHRRAMEEQHGGLRAATCSCEGRSRITDRAERAAAERVGHGTRHGVPRDRSVHRDRKRVDGRGRARSRRRSTRSCREPSSRANAATWQLGTVQVYDGGGTGIAGASGATLFETQGIFVP